MQTNYHMSVLVHEQAKKYGDREMLIYQDFGGKSGSRCRGIRCQLPLSR